MVETQRILPITYTAWSIRRILDEIERPGTGKRMTRRLPRRYRPGPGSRAIPSDLIALPGCIGGFRLPYRPGDLLYVREAWRTLAIYDHLPPRDLPDDAPIWYEADGPAPDGYGRYRHAMHMPRSRSRITQRVSGARVEMLWDISEADAIAEGCRPSDALWDGIRGCVGLAREAFEERWHQIHGPGTWAQNPWIAAYTMGEVWLANVDRLPARAA